MGILNALRELFPGGRRPAQEPAPEDGAVHQASTERGVRTNPENQLARLYRRMYVDPDLRQAILDLRAMDKRDGRVKQIHNRMARDAVKGGLRLTMGKEDRRVLRAWDRFRRRLGLENPQKLRSDARGLVMEGNLPLQWVLDPAGRVVAGVRMPSETILPQVTEAGLFDDPRSAYKQMDLTTGQARAAFALWQLTLGRLAPDNWDDMGALGRPYLDAGRAVWEKLTMTEEDLVIRRRTRAPLRMVHQLKNMPDDQVERYRKDVEAEQDEITTDYYVRGEGDVKATQGDAKLDQIADVAYLLDTFYSGAPAPKALFGYTEGLSRDILEDLKRDYFEEVDGLQDALAHVYTFGFRLELLLMGIDPDSRPFTVEFAERLTETPNQRADRALKLQALGASKFTSLRTAGLDPAAERERLEEEMAGNDPYPDPNRIGPGGTGPTMNVTPSNARKGESATTINTRT